MIGWWHLFNGMCAAFYVMTLGLLSFLLVNALKRRFPAVKLQWAIGIWVPFVAYDASRFYYATPEVSWWIWYLAAIIFLSLLVGIGMGFSINRRLAKKGGLQT